MLNIDEYSPAVNLFASFPRAAWERSQRAEMQSIST